MQLYAINAKNQLHGVVKNILMGDVVSEIELETPAGIVCSVITTSSLKILDIKIGDSAVAVIKATDVLLMAR
jgi:molybdopterin-binding protein